MTDNQSDRRAIYAWALRESASLRDHRLNCRDKTMWWSAVHQMLTKHFPLTGTSAPSARSRGRAALSKGQ